MTDPHSPASVELPLFPLHSVLFPGGALSLKIFEQRYMDLVAACLRDDRPFGVCLIAEGSEVGAPAVPHALGVTATIASWDMQPGGLLHIGVRGGERFRIVDRRADGRGLLHAHVDMLGAEPAQPVPERLAALVTLLRAMVAEAGGVVPEPHRFDDATWVGYRYAELLPISALARLKLLELDDAVSRLEIIHKYLAQRGLAK